MFFLGNGVIPSDGLRGGVVGSDFVKIGQCAERRTGAVEYVSDRIHEQMPVASGGNGNAGFVVQKSVDDGGGCVCVRWRKELSHHRGDPGIIDCIRLRGNVCLSCAMRSKQKNECEKERKELCAHEMKPPDSAFG